MYYYQKIDVGFDRRGLKALKVKKNRIFKEGGNLTLIYIASYVTNIYAFPLVLTMHLP